MKKTHCWVEVTDGAKPSVSVEEDVGRDEPDTHEVVGESYTCCGMSPIVHFCLSVTVALPARMTRFSA